MGHIRKGKHYDTNPFSSLPFICLDEMRRWVTFTDSCRYMLSAGFQENINKLFGMAFGFDHHVSSARFGWAYNPNTDRVDIYSYCYVRGERKVQHIFSAEIGREYEFCLQVKRISYEFRIFDGDNGPVKWVVGRVETQCYGYTLGLYFGGALPAPQDMEIKIRG